MLIKELFSLEELIRYAKLERNLKDKITNEDVIKEYKMTIAEFFRLFEEHKEKEATAINLEPFKVFLSNRWERIRSTDLAYPHAPQNPANVLCIQIAKLIKTAKKNKDQKDEVVHANTLLMPTVKEYFDYLANMGIDELALHEFILSDDDTGFISLAGTFRRAEDRGTKDLQTYSSSKDAKNNLRTLTETEKKRAIGHSRASADYYRAIEHSIELKSKPNESIGSALQKALDDYSEHSKDRLTVTVELVGFIEQLEENQKKSLFEKHGGQFGKLYKKLSNSNFCVQTARATLRSFIKSSPDLFSKNPLSRLKPAKEKFEWAMKTTAYVEASYGKEGKEKLKKRMDEVKLPEENNDFIIESMVLLNNDSSLFDDVESEYLFKEIKHHPHLLQEDMLFRVLNLRTNKKEDFNEAIRYLESATSDHDNNLIPSIASDFIRAAKEAKRNMSDSELPLLTELVYRTAIRIKKPAHEDNNARYPIIVEKVKECSWGRIVGGIALLIFAAGLITSAVLCGMATGGLAVPIFTALAWNTLKAATLGYALTSIFGFFGLLSAGRGVYQLARGTHHKVGVTAAGLFSQSAKKAAPKENGDVEAMPLLATPAANAKSAESSL